jgi:[protein-PII] uridylyltransferase
MKAVIAEEQDELRERMPSGMIAPADTAERTR